MAKPAQNAAGLTPKQEAAAQAFVTSGNMTAAYEAAGYSVRGNAGTVRRNAYALFSLPHVAARVQELRAQAAQKCVLTRERALAILAEIAEGRVTAYLDDEGHIDPRKVKGDGGADVEALDVSETINESSTTTRRRLRTRDPIRAIERAAKMCGWDKAPTYTSATQIVVHLQRPGDPPEQDDEGQTTRPQLEAPRERQAQAPGESTGAKKASLEQTPAQEAAAEQAAESIPQPPRPQPPPLVDAGRLRIHLDRDGAG